MVPMAELFRFLDFVPTNKAARFQVRLDLHRIAPFLRFVLARHDCPVKPRSLAKAKFSGELVARKEKIF
jgi:hypothetical protein